MVVLATGSIGGLKKALHLDGEATTGRGFISHCGWNLVLEATSHRAPFLGWPMTAEQYINAKFLVEEVGACVEIGRGNTCEVKDEDKARKIMMVMGENDVGVRALPTVVSQAGTLSWRAEWLERNGGERKEKRQQRWGMEKKKMSTLGLVKERREKSRRERVG
ncbi:hypothetical protein Cgig2_028220 [Carnegiea gigantea]|uniref:Uncharacterized protein n=1 Tax=Carnegiea gigantea TaxID=171969 RepID=A0A9Q1JIZ4_9CARY|nr:hypothetical protein Cgig2_028220 [Carnegiea gigantea]